MITLCLTNWNRPQNLLQVILPAMSRYRLIDEIIIAHGKKETAFDYDSERCRVVHRHDYLPDAPRNDLSRKWFLWGAARNETALSLDDDFFLPEETVEALHREYQKAPGRFHGVFGRWLDAEGRYDWPDSYGERLVVITGAALMPASVRDACLEYEPLVRPYVEAHSNPLWNGEDIFAALALVRKTGLLHQAHRLPIIDLGIISNAGVSADIKHNRYRRYFSQHALRRLGLDERLKKPSPPRAGARAAARAGRYLRARGGAFLRAKQRALRAKPQFLIVGVERGGTTSLFHYLAQHPLARPARCKETRHFAFDYPFGHHDYDLRILTQYLRNFPLKIRGGVAFEASPQYFCMPEAPARIADRLPRAKCIVLLRDPVLRAHSLYNLYRTQRARAHPADRETAATFEAALDREQAYFADGLPPLFSGLRALQLQRILPGARRRFPAHYAYVFSCYYAFWLRHWLRFVPRERLLVLQSERLFENPAAVVGQAQAFLDLAPAPVRDLSRKNLTVYEKAPLRPATRRRLAELFAPMNRELFDLLGEEYAWTAPQTQAQAQAQTQA